MKYVKKNMDDKQALRKLLRALKKSGFSASLIWDGEVSNKVRGEKEVLELVFGLDESWLTVHKTGFKKHTIFLVPNNGEPCDMFCDWSYTEGDPDGFNKLMDDYLKKIDIT